MTSNTFAEIIDFMRRLDDAKIYFRLEKTRYDAIEVVVTVPGERWEIDFLIDGQVDVEVFKSDGSIYGREKLEELFARFTD